MTMQKKTFRKQFGTLSEKLKDSKEAPKFDALRYKGDNYLICNVLEFEVQGKKIAIKIPVAISVRTTSKYMPHQGKRERARRAARLSA